MFFQGKGLIWLSDSALVNIHRSSATCRINKRRGPRGFTQSGSGLQGHIHLSAAVMEVIRLSLISLLHGDTGRAAWTGKKFQLGSF